jgi:SPP1 family predicted phage head-tail adaptor
VAHDDVVYFISIVDDVNALGDPIKVQQKNDYIFAEKKSIRQSEFYQAAATGLRPEIMFEVNSFEYNNEPMLEYEGKTYNIIRTFQKDAETIELVCEGVLNNAAS